MENKPFKTASDLEQQLGADIRRTRQQRGLTQAGLAERANISLTAMKHLEAGRGSSLSTLVRVARALDRSDWLAGFAPPAPAFSPLALLRERENSAPQSRKRVRPS